MKRIGFIGAGQMASALAKGIARDESQAIGFVIADPSDEARQRFCETVGSSQAVEIADHNQAAAEADVLFVAVKPQYLHDALRNVSGIPNSTLVISVVAGISLSELVRLTGTEQLIRVMPNTPCLIGKGASGFVAHPSVAPAQITFAKSLLANSGICVDVTEELIDSVTGVSGSGPAYVFTFVEALIDGGVLVGLDRATSRILALQTLLGATQMMLDSGEHPSVLRDRVTSPGGTTIAALKMMEETGFRDSVMSAVLAATEKARDLGS